MLHEEESHTVEKIRVFYLELFIPLTESSQKREDK